MSPVPSPLEALLPSPGSAPLCSAFTKDSRFDPGGSAIDADAVICIDVPGPWPKPVFDHPWLAQARSVSSTALGTTRVLARQPSESRPSGATVWYRVGAVTEAKSVALPDADAVARFLTELADRPPEGLAVDDSQRDAILVCVQGSHDRCCGEYGTLLAGQLDTAGYDIHRVSHTGGHRFAPTIMTMNDGRMWAWVDPDDVALLRAGDELPDDLVGRCRGWWGAKSGPAQVGERAIFAVVGRRLDATERTVSVEAISTVDGVERWKVAVKTSDGLGWRVMLERGSLVPTIACEQAGGLPYKLTSEFTIVDGPTPVGPADASASTTRLPRGRPS